MNRIGHKLSCVLAATSLFFLACSGSSTPQTVSGAGLGDIPDSISKSLTEGGPNPPDQTFNVHNTGDCDLAFTITLQGGGTWLKTPHPATGVAPANGGTVAVTFGLEVVTPPLQPGTYTGTIEIAGTCQSAGAANGRPAIGSPKIVAVNLTVQALNAVLGVNGADGGTFTGTNVGIVPLQDEWLSTGAVGAPPPQIGPYVFWTGSQMGVGTPFDVTANSASGLLDPYAGTWTALPESFFGPNDRLLAQAYVPGWLVAFGVPHVEQLDLTAATPGWRNGTDIPASIASSFGGVAVAGSRILVTANNPLRIAYYDPAAGGGAGAWDGPRDLGAGAGAACYVSPLGGPGLPFVGGRWLFVYQPASFMFPAEACICDLTTETCKATVDHLNSRTPPSVVWTGTQFIFATYPLGPATLYNPYLDQWTPGPTVNAPRFQTSPIAVWTGDRMIAYDGTEGGVLTLGATPAWTPMTQVNAPTAGLVGLVWTGSELLSWGGTSTGNGPSKLGGAAAIYH